MARKLTADQHQQRRDQVRELKIRCYTEGDIVRELRDQWGVGDRRVWAYIKQVNDEMQAHGAALPAYQRKYTETVVLEGLQLVLRETLEIAGDTKLSAAARALNYRLALQAQEMVGRAVGMFRDKVELTGAGGGPLALTIADARVRVREKLERTAAKLLPIAAAG